MKKYLRFLYTLIRLNILSAYGRRRAFWTQVIFMIINNLTFFVFWWLIFSKVKDLKGYTLKDMSAIYGISAGAWGLSVLIGGGRRTLAQHIAEGQLDPWLAQPKPVLPHVLLSHSYPSGLGDMISALMLWWFSGYGWGSSVFMYLIANIDGALVFTGAGVVAHSLAFWLGPVLPLARQYEEFMIFFSVNPQNVFGFIMKGVILTVLPAAFISYLPVEAIRQGSWSILGLSTLGCFAFAGLGAWVFQRGLKHYASGTGVAIGQRG